MKISDILLNNGYVEKFPLSLSGLMLGGLFGAVLLHPFSMFMQGAQHPFRWISPYNLMETLSRHHIPMVMVYILFGAVTGYVIYYLGVWAGVRAGEEARGKSESGTSELLIPICSYCKKIRDDAGVEKGEGTWHEVDAYFSKMQGSEFTHGVCPGCVTQFFEDLESNPYPKL